jgi:adenosylcobyric acid synthase
MTRATPAVMIQATGSNAGKSTMVAGLCRALVRRGLKVAPFKPQNMSNNAAVAVEGGEIGRAQAVQARAARMSPSIHMNPVLLKPEADTRAQIIVQGKRWGTLHARNYLERKAVLLPAVLDSFAHLARAADILLVEGAGSPAETNLRAGDIANMGFAAAADVPVVMLGDIDRGGVIASLAGTHLVLEPAERARIHAFMINKFRGDASLFDQGLVEVTRLTGWPSLGVVPWLPQAAWLPAEDAVDLDRAHETSSERVIAVPVLARIANFDDLDPLGMEPSVKLVFVRPGQPIPANADVVILPGSKSTIGDLAFLRAQGWDIDLFAHHRRGGHVLGLCGGYQMLGRSVADPDGIEGPAGDTPGLGLLDVTTVMSPQKTLTRVAAVHAATDQPIEGYEIHIGRTDGPDRARPFAKLNGEPEGAISGDGRIEGSYLHGLFTSDDFRRAYLAKLDIPAGDEPYGARVESALNALADHIEKHLDVEGLLALAR